jgi:hypothetical protein
VVHLIEICSSLALSALSPRDAVNHGSFHFLVGFQNAEPDPVPYPDSRVDRGAERHNGLMENHWNCFALADGRSRIALRPASQLLQKKVYCQQA